jgi:hypothetical protein
VEHDVLALSRLTETVEQAAGKKQTEGGFH